MAVFGRVPAGGQVEREDKELGDRLVKERLITAEQLKLAAQYCESLGSGSLRDILIKLGFVKDAVLDNFLGDQVHMASIDLKDQRIAVWAMERIPRKVIERHQVLPLIPAGHDGTDESALLLAMADPDNFTAVEEIQFLAGAKVETALATRSAVKKAINQYYHLVDQGEDPPGQRELSEKIFSAYPTEDLLEALLQTLAAGGQLDQDRFLARLKKLEGRHGRARYRTRA